MSAGVLSSHSEAIDAVTEYQYGENSTDEPPSAGSTEAFVVSEKPQFLFQNNLKQTRLYSLQKQFPISEKTMIFKEKHFPDVSLMDWQNWRWQIKNSITTLDKLKNIIQLSDDESAILENNSGSLPLRITPYYASLIDSTNSNDPIRRTVVPVINELHVDKYEEDDPLSEDEQSPVSGLIHRYPDRVLFLTTGFCSTYCRYCTRSRAVGCHNENKLNVKKWNDAFNYIASNNKIRDVIISGGDPLTLPDGQIKYLLTELRKIKHVEIIRIGTKVPVVLPHRITNELISIIKKNKPVWMNIHMTHADEITDESKEALNRLADAGVPLGSQTVLLKGINDNVESLTSLYHELVKARVRPYYLYQCDRISGSSHFRTPVEKGVEMIKGLRGHTSGLCIPQFVIDAPEGGGKVPLLPDYYQGQVDGYAVLKNYRDKIYRYRNEQDTCV